MKTYTLTLTEEQSEILGFALNSAKKSQLEKAVAHDRDGRLTAAEGCRSRAARIDEVAYLLDVCPIS